MSDELMEELRRVYEDAYWGVAQSTFDTRDPQLVAVLAVARHSAERQRGMEATPAMQQSGVAELRNPYWGLSDYARTCSIYSAMQSAAPLWVDKEKP